jgi:hypothetical protein
VTVKKENNANAKILRTEIRSCTIDSSLETAPHPATAGMEVKVLEARMRLIVIICESSLVATILRIAGFLLLGDPFPML